MRVLVATDGSLPAIEAAQRSISLLRADAEISLVMIIPEKEDPMTDAGGFEGPILSESDVEKDWENAVGLGTEGLAHTAEAVGPDVEVRLVPSAEPTGPAVVRTAQEMQADVLVIGASGANLLQRLFGTSVSEYILHHAHCPVLLVRHDH